ncbi:hypothetical protein SDJN02_17612, partial [Cucurbita argyrosperma subsp. argyrosperma]
MRSINIEDQLNRAACELIVSRVWEIARHTHRRNAKGSFRFFEIISEFIITLEVGGFQIFDSTAGFQSLSSRTQYLPPTEQSIRDIGIPVEFERLGGGALMLLIGCLD